MKQSSFLSCFAIASSLYVSLFFLQEKSASQKAVPLAMPLPAVVQKVALGYLRQLGGEIAFIRGAVFVGGAELNQNQDNYATPLLATFRGAAELHPRFVDTYFFTEAFLSALAPDYTKSVNDILAIGTNALPDNWIIPFFAAFNHFYYLDEPLHAARLYRLAAARPNGPIMLEHLANILSAEGGDIYAALIGLQGMYNTENNEQVKQRYAEEIIVFKKATAVLAAIKKYEKRVGSPPITLQHLVPTDILSIPEVGPVFEFAWSPPHLRVVRTAKKKKT